MTIFVSGLTDDEVQLAIQRSGSTEEVLPLTPVGLPQPVHAAQLVPVPHSESQSLTHRERGVGKRGGGALSVINLNLSTSQIVPLHI